MRPPIVTDIVTRCEWLTLDKWDRHSLDTPGGTATFEFKIDLDGEEPSGVKTEMEAAASAIKSRLPGVKILIASVGYVSYDDDGDADIVIIHDSNRIEVSIFHIDIDHNSENRACGCMSCMESIEHNSENDACVCVSCTESMETLVPIHRIDIEHNSENDAYVE